MPMHVTAPSQVVGMCKCMTYLHCHDNIMDKQSLYSLPMVLLSLCPSSHHSCTWCVCCVWCDEWKFADHWEQLDWSGM